MDVREMEVTHRRASVRGDEGEKITKPIKATSLASKSALTDQSSADEAPLSSDLELDPKAAETLLEGSSHVPTYLESSVSGLSPRLKNCVVRLFASIIMIGGFLFLIYLGPLALVLLSIFDLGMGKSDVKQRIIVRRSRKCRGPTDIVSWNCMIMCYATTPSRWFNVNEKCSTVTPFGFTHVSLLIIVSSSHFMIQSIFDGLIWFLVPVAMVISNDIFAYVFGMLFGKTPLIEVSPKKTWEGFIGGGICSFLVGLFLAWSMIDNKHFICPIEYDDRVGALSMDCIPDAIFIPRMHNVSRWLPFLPVKQFPQYPYFFHCLMIGAFISIIGPFGGFFASGFKRAFKIKDFGDVIPGHGGILDRFDCQIFVGWFVFFYYNSFIKPLAPSNLLQQVFVLPQDEQLAVLNLFLDGLIRRGHVPAELAQPLIAYGEAIKAAAATIEPP
nr:phosphatidate cytidylyltransferase [Hymenolepis microstoma]